MAITLAVVVAIGAGHTASQFMSPMYTASTTIVLTAADAFGDESPDLERRVHLEANRLTSTGVLAAVAERLSSDVTVDDLRDRVVVSTDAAIGVLDVTVTAHNPDAAAEIANTVAASYQQVSRDATAERRDAAQQELHAQASELRSEIGELQAARGSGAGDPTAAQRLKELRAQLTALQTTSGQITAEAAVFGAGVQDVEQALAPGTPSSPQPVRNGLMAGVIALAVGSAVAYWRTAAARRRLDPSVVLGAPQLAEIPDFGRSGTTENGHPLFDIDAAEAYQFVLAAFENAVADVPIRSVLVTSAVPGEGKTLTAVNLARASAIQGRDVTLVDSDIRARGLTRMLNADDEPGLVALADGADLDNVVRRYRISAAVHLAVVPAGRPQTQPTGLLATRPYREAIDKITATTELTIIDGGPLLTIADPSVLAMQVSAVLLVLSADTTEAELMRASQRLRLVATPVIGYVLNRARDGAARDAYPDPYGAAPAPKARRWMPGRPGDARASSEWDMDGR